MPAREHHMAGEREHTDPGREREPESERDAEQAEPPEDREAARDDQRERKGEPRRHRPPPEVERGGPASPEDEEAQDEPDVRGVEDVLAAPLEHVLREERDGRRPDEDPPAPQAPPVPVLGSRHAEDEGDAVAGEKGACGPHDDALAPEGDCDLEDSGRPEREEDLRDRELELEADLADHLQ